jgi:hypothetical protein
MLRDCWAAFRGGWKYQKANEKGRALETGRREDISFLLPRISRNQGPGGIPLFPEGAARQERAGAGESLVLIGYGSGGGALVSLADSPGFASLAVPVRGIIAVETGLWHAYEREEPQPAVISGTADWFSRIRGGIQNYLIRLKPRKVRVSRASPRPLVPVLYLLSDRALDPGPGRSRYGAIHEALRNSPGPAAIACLEGAGPLDYTAVPLIWPIYPAFFPGMAKTGRRGPELTETTVRLLGGFSTLTVKALPGGTAGPGIGPHGGLTVPGLRIESNAEFNAWYLTPAGQ